MEHEQHADLLALLKALAQETRLLIVGYTGEREYSVGELAGVLALKEPTVSHHLSKLHGVGLLRLRMQGNQRFYRLNGRRFAHFQALVQDMDRPLAPAREDPVNDLTWLDALPDEFAADDRKVLADCTFNGRLTHIPAKQKKLLVVLRWLTTQFEPERTYTEQEVNAVIKPIHEDYAGLRRDLISFGYLRRERGGGAYWLTPVDE